MNYPATSGRGIRNGIGFLAASSGVLDPLVNKSRFSFEPSRKEFQYSLRVIPSINHMIESIRVPHTEVGDIIVNGDCVDNPFDVSDQDDILVTQITNFKQLLDKV